MRNASGLRALDFIGSSREDVKAFPEEVRQDIGYALFEAQRGQKPAAAKPLQGFGGAGVLEIIERHDGNTYRVVYTVKFPNIVYVLHGFQKKAKHGIKTPQQDIELIKQRLRVAEHDYETHYRLDKEKAS
ncbi:MAG: type II toxin-antitoxin system RelE/ParE family toxin [Candidatus Omnitrophica bacterium]|nr:type II toxin-antitoxin system RelE/ParE family toxin [Candidatus Omnitrophota bacterium]